MYPHQEIVNTRTIHKLITEKLNKNGQKKYKEKEKRLFIRDFDIVIFLMENQFNHNLEINRSLKPLQKNSMHKDQ